MRLAADAGLNGEKFLDQTILSVVSHIFYRYHIQDGGSNVFAAAWKARLPVTWLREN